MANKLTQWRPFISYEDSAGRLRKQQFKTYNALKRELPRFLKEYESITVYRSRRGQWGEWFENWDIIDGKPTIVRQGWM